MAYDPASVVCMLQNGHYHPPNLVWSVADKGLFERIAYDAKTDEYDLLALHAATNIYVRVILAVDNRTYRFECYPASWLEAVIGGDAAVRRARTALNAVLDRITELTLALQLTGPPMIHDLFRPSRLRATPQLRMREDVFAHLRRRAHLRETAAVGFSLGILAACASSRALDDGYGFADWGVYVVRGCPASPQARTAVLCMLAEALHVFGFLRVYYDNDDEREYLTRYANFLLERAFDDPSLLWADAPWPPGAYRRLSRQSHVVGLQNGAPIVYFQPSGGDDRHILESALAIWTF